MKRVSAVLGILAIFLWLAMPAVTLADNCQNLGEDERDRKCSVDEKIFGFFTGMAIMAGLATWKRDPSKKAPPLKKWGEATRPSAPPKTPEPDYPWWDPRGYF
jgi:hypothetical protein